MKILGISAFYHDAAASIIIDGKIIAAAQEERFTRKKHDPSFPVESIRFCLDFARIGIDELDAVAFYDKPFLKFERLLETYYAYAPAGLISFLRSMPVWINQKLFLKKIIADGLKSLGNFNRKKAILLFPEHHLSHAASAYYPSGFESAAIVTIDGVGEWATASIGRGDGQKITVLKELDFPNSIGLLYSAFTYYCGFKVNSGEYKLMGLAPYGNTGSQEYLDMHKKILNELIDIREDGSVLLHQKYFSYTTGDRMANDRAWKELFGFERREPETVIDQRYCNLALAIQKVTEEIVTRIAREARKITGLENLVMAGGVALNAVANGKLEEAEIFSNIFIQPAAGDAGGALGAALAASHIYFNEKRIAVRDDMEILNNSLLGPEYDEPTVENMMNKFGAVGVKIGNEDELVDRVAKLISGGNSIGWFQGRMEFGPRALGARSIIADARNEEIQKKLNLQIKFRESFRPFAPAVLAEDAAEYFDIRGKSPYMLLVKKISNQRVIPFPKESSSWSMEEKLYFKKSDLPCITHVDYSARIQTVHQHSHPRFWKLLNAFKKQTGYAVLANTSFNIRGEPIVNTPEDAYRCFMITGLDWLVIGNYIFEKSRQPAWIEKQPNKKQLIMDEFLND